MSGNPYIDEVGYLEDGPRKGSRTSVLAVASLASSLVCCIPLLGVISIVFGAASLLLIGRSNGRLTGKGAAIAGLIVGIMTTVIWGAIGAGTLQGWSFYSKQMIPVGESAMFAVNRGDVTAMRALLNPAADADVTDEQILAFMAACELEMGTVSEASRDPGTIWESFIETFKRSQGNNQGGGGQFDEEVAPTPIGIETANGKYLIWTLFDATTLKGQQDRKLADIMVMQDGKNGFALRDDGPGKDMCNTMSLRSRTSAGAIEWREEEERKKLQPEPPIDDGSAGDAGAGPPGA
jgi:hypothetical protein